MSVGETILKTLTDLVIFVTSYIASFVGVFIRPSQKSIEGELILVSGAGHGIGREIALELSRLGAVLVLVDVNQENNEKTGAEIKEAGGKAYTYTCDITSAANVNRLAEQIQKDVGHISILWNNAGVLNGGRFLDLTEKAIRRTFDVNIMSHFWMVQAFLPNMMRKGQGHIIGTVSMAAFSPSSILVDYCASKAAAFSFAESLREELVASGYPNIQISSLCPYFVNTGLVKSFEDKLNRTLTAKQTAVIGVDGMLRNEEVIFAPRQFWISTKLMQMWPRKTTQLMTRRVGNVINPQFKKED